MVSEPIEFFGPKSMAEEEQPLIGLQKKLQEKKHTRKLRRLKYSCEEVYERMDNGLCLFCDELDTPGHHDLKHKGIQIFIVDDDLTSQTQETVTKPEPIVETANNFDPFIKPLERASVLQVLGSVPDVLMAHRMDSHVKEVEESSQQSTNGNDKIVAHQLFDQMPNEYQKDLTVIESSNKEVLSFSHKDARVWEPGGLLTKMDHWDWFEKELKPHKNKSHQIETFEATDLLNKDPQEIIWDCVNKEFKETVAGCGNIITDRFKLVDETLKPAVYDGTNQIRVWDCGGSPLDYGDESPDDEKPDGVTVEGTSNKPVNMNQEEESNSENESRPEFSHQVLFSQVQHTPPDQYRAPFNPYQNCNDQCHYKREFGNYTEPGIEFDRASEEVEDDELQDKQPEDEIFGVDKSVDMTQEVNSTPENESSPIVSPQILLSQFQLGQANSHDGKEFKGLNLGKLLRNEGLLSIVCLFGSNDMSCWTQLLRQQIFPKSWRFKFKTGPRESKLLNNKFFFVEESNGEAILLNTYRAVCLDVYNRNLETDLGIYLYEYKNQMLLLGYHGLEVQVLSCLQEFGEGPKTDTHIVLCWKKLASFLWFLHGKKLLDAGQKMQSMLVSDFKTWVPHFGYELRLAGTDPVLGLVWSSFESDMNRLWRGPEAVLSFNSEKMGLDWFFQRDLHKSYLDIRRMIILLCSSADYRKLNLWVDTNYCEIRPDRTHVELQEMSYFLSEKSLVEFVGYKAHGRDLLVVGVKQFTLAATKFHLKHKWRSKFGSNKLTRTWTSYSRYDSSSCALRQEENYVLVLFIIIEALTLFNDQHTLVAEKNGTETSIVLKQIFGTSQDYDLLLFLERVKATFEIMLTVEHFENPLASILTYEVFHLQRPPEISTKSSSPNILNFILEDKDVSKREVL